MAPNQNVTNAFRAMKNLGIAEETVKPVLKNLLKVYDKNWDFIEADNYQALVDAIFEIPEGQAAHPKKRTRAADSQAAGSQAADSQAAERKKKKSLNEEVQIAERKKIHRNADQEEAAEVNEELDRPLKRLRLRYQENNGSASSGANPKQKQLQTVNNSLVLLKPKDEPTESLPFHSVNKEKRSDGGESSSQLELASTASGRVKIFVSCNPLPSLDELFKRTEEKCMRSNKLLGPSFSVRQIMKELCECALELGTCSSKVPHEENNGTPVDDVLRKSTPVNVEAVTEEPPTPKGSVHTQDAAQEPEILCLPPTSNGMDDGILTVDIFAEHNSVAGGDIEPNGMVKTNPHSLAVVEHEELISRHSLAVVEHEELMPTQTKTYAVNDISRGLEGLIISVVNELNSKLPLAFRYMPGNVKFENADVSFSLARIGGSYCSCVGDCVSDPCNCAHAVGGVAYTIGGLIKENFLEECIAMNHDSRKQSLFYCKECPLERSKLEDAKEGCKGHLVRKFIKECWWKCSCNGQCGNRVVQRGIKRNLQVFMSPKGKGWGLRTLENLPKGAFVCEFAGEILTIKELYTRVSQTSNTEKYEFPVLLDADWGARVMKDEEALCLDAANYGNVARFINHRCFDANLVGIPVEVDTPEHHYYRFAFFTTRKVDALEELTRDYGIDFDDHGNQFKTFECLCESKFCRNLRRKTRSRSANKRRA